MKKSDIENIISEYPSVSTAHIAIFMKSGNNMEGYLQEFDEGNLHLRNTLLPGDTSYLYVISVLGIESIAFVPKKGEV